MTNPKELAERAAVVAEALTWVGTPFEWGSCVKGAGVDCGRFLGAAFTETGVKRVDLANVAQPPPQWFMHRGGGDFLNAIRQFAAEYELRPGLQPKPADIVVAKYGHDWAHSALVIQWPRVVAAACGFCVTEWPSIFRSPQYAMRPLKYFDPWAANERGAR